MTLQTIACNAAVRVRNRLLTAEHGGGTPELVSQMRDTLQRIENRFSIVYIRSRAAFFHEDEAVRIGSNYEHVDDVYTCERCDDSCVEHGSVQSRSPRGRLVTQLWCEECYDNYSSHCTGCGETFDHDEESGDIIEGEWHCSECAESADRSEEVPSYHGAKRWDLVEGSKPAYSAELELESTERGELVQRLESLNMERVSWERDGSLDYENGLEILIQFRKTTDELATDTGTLLRGIKGRNLGLRSWEGAKCGFHLNSNRNRSRWNNHKVMRLLYIVHTCKTLLVRISGRESNQWASFVPCGTLRELADGSGGKYRALRVGWDRFEWRMFKGTLNPKRIKLYCDTVKHLEELACSDIPAHHLRSCAETVLVSLLSTFNS